MYVIKFRNNFTKFIVSIIFDSVVEVINIRTSSHKVKCIHHRKGSEEHFHPEKENFKIKNRPIYHKFLMKLCHLLWRSTSPEKELQYLRNSSYLDEVWWNISDLTFV